MHHDADETMPETSYASLSEMIAETLAMISEEETDWPNVLAPQRVTRDTVFTKTF